MHDFKEGDRVLYVGTFTTRFSQLTGTVRTGPVFGKISETNVPVLFDNGLNSYGCLPENLTKIEKEAVDRYDAIPPNGWDKISVMSDKPLIRKFDTGATRDLDENKLDYEGFFSPLVVERYAAYMHTKRKMADGSLRDSDNWQKGIPLTAYMKSAFRHFMDVWSHHRGWKQIALEPLEIALCGLLFNVQGYLHEIIKARIAAADKE